jgi:hypothetical protein
MVCKNVHAQGYYVRKKGMICDCQAVICTKNLWQEAEMGKKTGTESTTGFPRASCFEKTTHSVQEMWGHMYDVLPWSA